MGRLVWRRDGCNHTPLWKWWSLVSFFILLVNWGMHPPPPVAPEGSEQTKHWGGGGGQAIDHKQWLAPTPNALSPQCLPAPLHPPPPPPTRWKWRPFSPFLHPPIQKLCKGLMDVRSMSFSFFFILQSSLLVKPQRVSPKSSAYHAVISGRVEKKRSQKQLSAEKVKRKLAKKKKVWFVININSNAWLRLH